MNRFQFWHTLILGHRIRTIYVEWDFYRNQCSCGTTWNVWT